jgi:hypothetical protein
MTVFHLMAREAELFRLAVDLAVQLDRCNPEVGMGPTREMIARQVANRLSFDVSEDDIAEAAR